MVRRADATPLLARLSSLAFALVTGLRRARRRAGHDDADAAAPAARAAEPRRAADGSRPLPSRQHRRPATRGVDRASRSTSTRASAPPARTGFQIALRTRRRRSRSARSRRARSMSEASRPQVADDRGHRRQGHPGSSSSAATSVSPSAAWATTLKKPLRRGRRRLHRRRRSASAFEASSTSSPTARWNPWIGYGIGYEIAGASGTQERQQVHRGARRRRVRRTSWPAPTTASRRSSASGPTPTSRSASTRSPRDEASRAAVTTRRPTATSGTRRSTSGCSSA